MQTAAGRNIIKTDLKCGLPTADLTTIKMLLDSTVLTHGANFMSIYIKIITAAPRLISLKTTNTPGFYSAGFLSNIFYKYNLRDLIHNVYNVYI